MIDRSAFATEQRLPESTALDTLDAAGVVGLMNAQDRVAVDAVAAVAADVARAAELVAGRLAAGGRLVYVGAGSSGRLGVLDAAECPPTFRSEPGQVVGVMAGGDAAMFRAREGAEDDAAAGAAAMDERQVGPDDAVCGIAAGGTTPFVHGALAEARRRGAATLFVTCVGPFAGEPVYDVTVRPVVGPEVLTGSTRLKAGTATKLVCNQLTTTAFVLLGKCYENLMVDVKASNAKLLDRATRMVATIGGVAQAEAARLLAAADGRVKTAAVMGKRGCDAETARAMLTAHGGRLRAALVPSPGVPGEGRSP